MKTILFLLVLLALPISPRAKDWSRADTHREILWQAIHLVDWGQTLDIARSNGKYFEINPLMGRHPSIGHVNNMMLAGAIAHLAGAYLCPDDLRSVYQWVSIIVNGAIVLRNHQIGLRVNF